MAQNITLTIGGRPYKLVASSPEMERNMRLSAEEIDSMLSEFSKKYPTASEADKAIFTSLNKTIEKIQAKEVNKAVKAEVDDLCKRLDNYLASKEI